MAAGEQRQLGRDDDGHARPHVGSPDQRRVTDPHAPDVGDRIVRSRFELADPEAEISRAHPRK